MNRCITPPPSSPCSSSSTSSSPSLSLSLQENDRNDQLLVLPPLNESGGIDSSYEDVMSLIQEAKAVSDSIDHSLQDMKLQFFELADSWKADQPEEEEDYSLVVKDKKPGKKDKKKKKAKKNNSKKDKKLGKVQPLKKKTEEEKVEPTEQSELPLQKKKRVRFAPPSDLCQIEYIDFPTAEDQDFLYVNSQEQQDMITQLQQDVDDYEDGRPDYYYDEGPATLGDLEEQVEYEEYTSRGLERRSVDGQEIRMEWRTTIRDAVLDEQERQWMELPPNEPCDVYDIAQVSLVCSRDSKEYARELAIQDELDVYYEEEEQEADEEQEEVLEEEDGCDKEDDIVTVVTALSESSWSTSGTTTTSNTARNRLSWSLSSLVEDDEGEEEEEDYDDDNDEIVCCRDNELELYDLQEEEEETTTLRRRFCSLVAASSATTAGTDKNLKLNSKGYSVQWPDEQQEEESSSSLEQVYSYELPLALLPEEEEQDGDDDAAASASACGPGVEEAKFHFKTSQEEDQYQQVRLQMFLQVYDPRHINDPIKLAKKCYEISSEARILARQRAMDIQSEVLLLLQDDGESTAATTATTTTNRSSRRGGLASRLSQHPSLCNDDDDDDDVSGSCDDDSFLRALYLEEEETLHTYYKQNSMTWNI